MRALGLDVATRVLEAEMVSAPSSIALALRVPASSQVVYMRRLRFVEGVPAAIHLSYLPARCSALLNGDLSGSLTDLMAREGWRVAQARDAVEAVAATGDEARLFEVHVGAPLVLIRGVAYSVSEEPLRYSEALYRGDRWRFNVDSNHPDFRPEPKTDGAGPEIAAL
jgi:GntR family transcriptional regulator